MVDRRFGRYRLLRALGAAVVVVAALVDSRLAAQAPPLPDSTGQSEVPELPSKGAPPPKDRLASRQSLSSGEGPLPPGLMNNTPNLESLPSSRSPSDLDGLAGLTGKEIVVRVVIDPPLKHVKEQDARRQIKTMADRPYDVRTIEDDVRRLERSKLFQLGVRASYQRVGGNGIVVIYHVVEKPTIKYLKFFGNEKVRERHLKKQSGLKVGDPWEPWNVEDARNKVEEYYHEKGFNKAKVITLEGSRQTDRGVVYLVNEGRKQKIAKVEFVGNSIASGGRLKTQIQTKPPLLYLFKGEVDRQKIEEDLMRVRDYYHNLGFFKVKVSRELQFNEDQSWLTVRFIIDEGPRYKVRNITFIGPKVFSAAQLSEKLKLTEGQFFDRAKLDKDITVATDRYGAKGYVFVAVQPQVQFLEDPDDELDIVYQVEEGRPCIVSRIDVKIAGDNPHTRRNTILNRVSLHPGDLLSTREVRNSERRLKASALFKVTPGDEPHIDIHKPLLDEDTGLADKPRSAGGFRGQSPDPKRGAP